MAKPILDMDARYAVDGMPDVAFRVQGFVQRADEDTEWTGIHQEDPDWVVAVMVGDDCKHVVEVSGLRKLEEDEYCNVCGQIGCGHGV